MDFLDLLEEILELIVRRLNDRDRFGHFAATCRRCLALAYSSPLDRLSFALHGPLGKYAQIIASIPRKDFDFMIEARLENELREYFASSSFLARLDKRKVLSLEVCSAFPCTLPLLFQHFPQIQSINLELQSNYARLSEELPEERRVLDFSVFPRLRKIKLRNQQNDPDPIRLPFNTLRDLSLSAHFAQGGPNSKLLEQLSIASELTSLEVDVDSHISLKNLVNLQRLVFVISTDEDRKEIESFQGTQLESLKVVAKRGKISIPMLNHLAKCLGKLSARGFASVPSEAVDQLRVKSLAMANYDKDPLISFHLDTVSTLRLRPWPISDWRSDKFSASTPGFENLTSLALFGTQAFVEVRSLFNILKKLQRFHFLDFPVFRPEKKLSSAELLELLQAFDPNLLVDLRLSQFFATKHLEKISRFSKLIRLELTTGWKSRPTDSWFSALSRLKNLETLTIIYYCPNVTKIEGPSIEGLAQFINNLSGSPCIYLNGIMQDPHYGSKLRALLTADTKARISLSISERNRYADRYQ